MRMQFAHVYVYTRIKRERGASIHREIYESGESCNLNNSKNDPDPS